MCANPVSAIPNAQLPYQDTIITTQDGTPTLLFHRFLTGIWQRTGGAAGVNNSDVQQVASEALTLAERASNEAALAEQQAVAASASAALAATEAAAAQTAANNAAVIAQSVQNTALIRSQNLADLTSASNARSNLGLSTFPLTFSFDTCPASLSRGIPITRSLTLPANFAGTVAWWGVAATGTVIFNVGRSRAPSSSITAIGTITVVAGTGIQLSMQGSVSLSAGDTLVMTTPGSPDATLAQVSFSFPLTLA